MKIFRVTVEVDNLDCDGVTLAVLDVSAGGMAIGAAIAPAA